MRIEDRLFDRGWMRSAMATRKCGNIYFRKIFMAVRKFTNIFVYFCTSVNINGSRMHDVGPPPRPLPVTEEDTPPTTPASYRVPPRARHLPTAFVRSGPQEDWVLKRGSYHSTTATSVRGRHGQTTGRAPPEAADGRKTNRGGRSRQGTPGAELDGLSQGRLPSIRSHRRLYGGQPAHIRS